MYTGVTVTVVWIYATVSVMEMINGLCYRGCKERGGSKTGKGTRQ